MAQEARRNRRVIEFSPQADADRLLIFIYTAEQWGERQAQRYDDLLQNFLEKLVLDPLIAPFVSKDLPGVRNAIVKWKNAHHGHRVFFRETAEGIWVMRIFHTAMNWPDHLDLDN